MLDAFYERMMNKVRSFFFPYKTAICSYWWKLSHSRDYHCFSRLVNTTQKKAQLPSAISTLKIPLLTPEELFMLITWLQCTPHSLSVTLANEALQDRKEQREILKQQGQRWCCPRVFNVFLFVASTSSSHTQRRFLLNIRPCFAVFSPYCFLCSHFTECPSANCFQLLSEKVSVILMWL